MRRVPLWRAPAGRVTVRGPDSRRAIPSLPMNLKSRAMAGQAGGPSDTELVDVFRAIAGGGVDAENALAALHDAYARRLLGFVRSRGFTLEEAEDVVQESFLRMYRAGARLRDVESPRAYLYRTVQNCASDLLRQKRKAEKELAVEPDALVGLSEAKASREEDRYDGLGDCLDAAFTRFETEAPDRAFVIRLAVVEELNGREVAAALNRSYGAAREFLSQSRIRFRRLVSELCGEYLHAEGS